MGTSLCWTEHRITQIMKFTLVLCTVFCLSILLAEGSPVEKTSKAKTKLNKKRKSKSKKRKRKKKKSQKEVLVTLVVAFLVDLVDSLLEDLEDHHQVLVGVPQEDLEDQHQALVEVTQEDLEGHQEVLVEVLQEDLEDHQEVLVEPLEVEEVEALDLHAQQ